MHPSGLVTVKEYVLVVTGLTVTDEDVCPSFHKKVEPTILLDAESVDCSPTQISLSVLLIETKGRGLTTMFATDSETHP